MKNRKHVVCEDGFRMSVQASSGHYCEPRDDNAPVYTAVEVGFPSEAEPLLMQYIDGDMSAPTENVYGWVPAHVIHAVIAKHGGMVAGETPPLG